MPIIWDDEKGATQDPPGFRDWYGERAKRLGLNPDPDARGQFYDYREAFLAGAEPDTEGHWPSTFKMEGHPRLVVDGINTKTGQRVQDKSGIIWDDEQPGTAGVVWDTEPGDRTLRATGTQLAVGITQGVGTLPGTGAGILKTFIEKARTPVTVKIPTKVSDVPQTLWDIATLGIKLPTIVPRLITSQITKYTTLDEQVTKKLQGFIEKNQQKVAEIPFVAKTPDPTGFFQKAARAVGSGAPSLAIAAGITISTGDPTAAAVVFGAMAESQTYQDAIRSGMAPQEAESIAAARGVIEGGLEYVGLKFLFGRYGGRLRTALIRAAEEPIQEALQSIGQHMIEVPTFAKDRTKEEVLEDVFYSAFAGLVLGGGMAGAMSMIEQRHPGISEDAKEKVAIAAEDQHEKISQDFLKQEGVPEEIGPAEEGAVPVPTGQVMPGPEHPGAIPGTTRPAGQDLPEALEPEEVGGLNAQQEQVLSLQESVEPEATFRTGQPVTFNFVRNTEKAPDMGERFQQHIEPRGPYMQRQPRGFKPVGTLVGGEISFQNPLVMEFNTGEVKSAYDENNWKARLSQAFGGLTGTELSQAIRDAGFDGIVTVGARGETSEMVDLTRFTPSKVPTPEPTQIGQILAAQQIPGKPTAPPEGFQGSDLSEADYKKAIDLMKTDPRFKVQLDQYRTENRDAGYDVASTGEFDNELRQILQQEPRAFGSDLTVEEYERAQELLKSPRFASQREQYIKENREAGYDVAETGEFDNELRAVLQAAQKPPQAPQPTITPGPPITPEITPEAPREAPFRPTKALAPVSTRPVEQLTMNELTAEAKRLDIPAFTTVGGALRKGWTEKRLRVAILNRRKKGPEAFRAGFQAGRLQLKLRKAKVLAIQKLYGLTDAEFKDIRTSDIGVMTEGEFKKAAERMEKKAAITAKTKQARTELREEIEVKKFKKVDNLRNALKLPTIKNMKLEHIEKLAEALKPFQEGDEFLSVRKIETVDRTELEGIRTLREARERLAKKLGVPVLSLMSIKVSELDRFRFDTGLAERNEFYRMMVEGVARPMLVSEAEYLDIEQDLLDLVRKIKPKPGVGLKTRVLGFLIPQHKIIRRYMEAPADKAEVEARGMSPDTPTKETLAAEMTKEELDLAHYMHEHWEAARLYLLKREAMKLGKKHYFVHLRRGFLEAWKEHGIMKAFGEMWARYKQEEQSFEVMDRITGDALAFDKFFQFAMHRTGGLIPTENAVKAFLVYMKTFKKKQALDEATPTLMIYADSLTPQETTKTGLLLHGSMIRFVKEWMNTKKGRKITTLGIKQGGVIDRVLRAGITFTAYMDLGLNFPVMLASQVGEQVSTYQLLGKIKFARGKLRQNTKKGKRIVEKYRNLIGKNPWKELVEPAKDVGNRLSEGMFVLFRDASVRANKTFILGSLSAEEYAAETIAPARLAALRTELGRYRTTEGAKSVIGATSLGRQWTQYKTWAIPHLRTSSKNLRNITTRLRSKKVSRAEKIKSAQEVYRLAELTLFVILIRSMLGGDDPDRNSFVGKLKEKLYRESMTHIQALNIATMVKAGRLASWVEEMAENLWMLATLERYKTTGELKGPRRIKRQLTPTAVKQLLPKPEKKKKKSPFL